MLLSRRNRRSKERAIHEFSHFVRLIWGIEQRLGRAGPRFSRDASKKIGRAKLLAHGGEFGSGSAPLQLVNALKEHGIGSKGCQFLE